MPKNFKDLRAQMSRANRTRAARQARAMARELPLTALRASRRLSQETVAATLQSRQSSVSRLERRADMHVSTLRDYVRALGGELEIAARFPDGTVRIIRFDRHAL